MTIYENNMLSKEKGIAVFVEPADNTSYKSLSYPVNIENLTSKSGLPTAKIRINQQDNGFFMHSAYEPLKEAEKQVSALNFEKNCMFVVFGIGQGYHLFELQRKMSGMSRVMVIENSMDIFNNAMNNIDMRGIFEDQRFTFLIGLHPDQAILFIKELMRIPLNFYLLSNVQFLTLSYYEKLFPRVSHETSKTLLEKILSKWHSLGNAAADTIIGLVQNFYNIDEAIFNPGIDQFINKYKGKPAIIVSAGPSLDKNIDLLKEVEGKALIVATDATLRALIKKGIKPDAVVSLERVLVYEQLLKDRDYEIPEDVVWAGPPLVEPAVFKEFKKNKKIICYKAGETINTWIDEILGGKGTIFMGNSVAHVALGFAIKVGADPIICVGQDLAFSETGETHGAGIDDKVKSSTTHYTQPNQIVYLEDYNGNPIRSTMLWKTMLIEFENVIFQYKERTFIDATEGGAFINGTKVMTLRETIDQYIENQKIESLCSIVPEVKIDDSVRIYNALIESVKEKQEIFKKMLDLSQECLDNVRITNKKYESIYENMSSLESEKIREILLKSNEVYDMMKSDIITIIFFQGLMSVAVVEVNNLGLEASNENLWKNLLIQEEFLLITRDTCLGVVGVFNKILQFLEDKAQGESGASIDYDKYLKILAIF